MSSSPINPVPAPRPTVLFRGDQATRYNRKSGQSLMVDKYATNGLYTNLICGGNPLAIARDGITPTVAQHIKGWDKSHYLSFSEDQLTAEAFAGGMTRRQLTPSRGNSWDAVMLSFDIAQISWTGMRDHVYFGEKILSSPPPYFVGSKTRLALIDCVSLLRQVIRAGRNDLMHELDLAFHDKEWLIVPLDPMPPAPNSYIGYSAQLLPSLISGAHYDFL